MYHPRLSEALAVVSCIDPDANATGAINGDVIDMSKHARVMFIVMVGTLGSTATIDFAVYAIRCAVGLTSSAVITGKSITQLTAGRNRQRQAGYR